MMLIIGSEQELFPRDRVLYLVPTKIYFTGLLKNLLCFVKTTPKRLLVSIKKFLVSSQDAEYEQMLFKINKRSQI